MFIRRKFCLSRDAAVGFRGAGRNVQLTPDYVIHV